MKQKRVFSKRQAVLAGFLIVLAIVLFGVIQLLESRKLQELVARPPVAATFWGDIDTAAEPDSPMRLLESIGGEPRQKVSRLDGRRYPVNLAEVVMAVMIENHPASRPQMNGLPEASIVYEALAEGGITRYLAIFGYQDLARVGPVRSARPYFLDWAEEYGGAYIHAGGSTAALQDLRSTLLLDFDEDGEIVYRDFRYLRPHNVFADLGLIKSQLIEKNRTNNVTDEWFDFEGEIPVIAESAIAFTIDFSLPSYLVDYVYDAEQDDYRRLLAGKIHTDASSTAVRPRNVIVQFASYWPIDDEGRLEFVITGEGAAWYFSGGRFWTGTWKKTAGGRTEFFDAKSQPVSLQPGQTFIEVIDSAERVEVSGSEG